MQLESYVYIEIMPALADETACGELANALREVLSWVVDVTADHRRMILAIREVMANLEFAGPAIEGGEERAEKVRRFLDWVVDGRFVLVGMRRYRVSSGQGGLEVQSLPGTGLGMWRADETSRLFEAKSGDAIPPDLREELEDRRIILISKSHMESRLHRHGRLDRIMVKEHDDVGRVVGMTIIVGLFTQRVLRTPGSQIPLLTERLARVIEGRDMSHGSHRHQSIRDKGSFPVYDSTCSVS